MEYQLELVPSPEDIDELDHVSNLTYLRWVIAAARAHSDARGLDFAAYRRHGGVFVVKRHEIDYLHPAVANDRIAVITWVESWQSASSFRRTRIVRVADGRELASARTQWVFISLERQRPTRIPAEVKNAFCA